MSKHTPGPWTYEHDEDKPFTPEQVFAGRILIAQVIGDSAETEANAHLIAAAPDMLEDLKSCRSSICGYSVRKSEDYLKPVETLYAEIKRIDSIARAAIARLEDKTL